MRVLNIKETGKREGDLYPVELIPDVFFCLQVDGPITGGGGLVSGWAYKWQLTVFMYLSVSLEAVKPCQNLACY